MKVIFFPYCLFLHELVSLYFCIFSINNNGDRLDHNMQLKAYKIPSKYGCRLLTLFGFISIWTEQHFHLYDHEHQHSLFDHFYLTAL